MSATQTGLFTVSQTLFTSRLFLAIIPRDYSSRLFTTQTGELNSTSLFKQSKAL